MSQLAAQKYLASRFESLEQEMQKANVFMHSLNTSRRTASKPVQLASYVGVLYDDTSVWLAFSDFLEQMFQSICYHFPENIFWDLDYMISYAVRESKKSKSPELFWERYTHKLTHLLAVFGSHGEIRFRYLHDFTYGFDWARWVRKDVLQRKNIDPFSIAFFDRTIERGEELLQLIRQDDSKYHRLQSSSYRNPFSFSRDIAEEKEMMRWLSKHDALPVQQWDINADVSFERDFDLIRQWRSQHNA